VRASSARSALAGRTPEQDQAVAEGSCPHGMGRLTILENGDVVRSWQDLNMTEIPARLSIITLGAREMDVLRSFYRTLGWPELPNGDSSWTGFLLGGVLLALFPISDLTAEAAPDSTAPTGWSGVTLACTVGTRDEVDSAFDAAVGGRRYRPVVGRPFRVCSRPRGQPVGDHLVTAGYIRRTRCPAVLGLSRRPCCEFLPLFGDIFNHGLMQTTWESS